MSNPQAAELLADGFWSPNPYQSPRLDAHAESIWSELTPDTVGMMVGGAAGLYLGVVSAQLQLAGAHWIDQFVWADLGYAIGSFSGGLIGVAVQLARWVNSLRY